MKVMDWAMAVSHRELAGCSDGGGKVGFGIADCLGDRSPLGQQSGDGGGERAPGAVGVSRGDPRRTQFDLGRAIVEDVDAFLTIEVAAFQQHVTGAELEQVTGRNSHFGDRSWFGSIQQHARFGQIGCDDFGQGKEFTAQGLDRVGLQQVVAAF